MLSREAKSAMKFVMNTAHFLGGSPCGLIIDDKKTNEINVKNCPNKGYWIQQIYQIVYFVYLIYVAATYPNRNDRAFRALVATILMQAIICILSLNFLILFTYFSGDSIINKYFDLLTYFERKYVKPGTKLRDGSEILMGLVVFVCFGFPFLYMGAMIAAYWNGPVFLYYIFPKEFQALRFWYRVPITLFQLGLILSGWSVILYHVVFLLTAGSVYKLLNEMCPNRKSYITNDNFRKQSNLQHSYRCLQILFVYIQIVLKNMIPPVQFCLNKMFLVCNFNLMKHSSHRKTPKVVIIMLMSASGISITAWVIVLYLAGQFSHRSKICLRQMKSIEEGNRHERKIMSKFLKSCLPLRVWFGEHYVIKHVTFIKYFMGSIRGTGKVLLAFNRNK